MTYYGMEATAPQPPRTRTFRYRISRYTETHTVEAQQVYFYEGGFVGFWNDLPGDDRQLVLACKPETIWETT